MNLEGIRLCVACYICVMQVDGFCFISSRVLALWSLKGRSCYIFCIFVLFELGQCLDRFARLEVFTLYDFLCCMPSASSLYVF